MPDQQLAASVKAEEESEQQAQQEHQTLLQAVPAMGEAEVIRSMQAHLARQGEEMAALEERLQGFHRRAQLVDAVLMLNNMRRECEEDEELSHNVTDRFLAWGLQAAMITDDGPLQAFWQHQSTLVAESRRRIRRLGDPNAAEGEDCSEAEVCYVDIGEAWMDYLEREREAQHARRPVLGTARRSRGRGGMARRQ